MEGRTFTYKRTSGVDAYHGAEYEWDLLTLVYLRCMILHRQWKETGNSGIKSFFIANNVQHIGVFDDLILRMEIVVDGEIKTRLTFVQCKHVLDPRKSGTRFEKYINDKTQIKKWFDAVLRIRRILSDENVSKDLLDKIKNKEMKLELHRIQTDEILQLRDMLDCKNLEFECLYYTNMRPEEEDFSKLFENIPFISHLHQLLTQIFNSTDKKNFDGHFKESVLRFITTGAYTKKEQEILEKEFCNRFVVFFSQADELKSLIKEEMMKEATSFRDLDSLCFHLMQELKQLFSMSDLCELLSENTELLRNIQCYCDLKIKAINIVNKIHPELVKSPLFSIYEMEKLNSSLKFERVNIFTGSNKLEKLKLIQFFFTSNMGSLLIFLNEKDVDSWMCARKTNIYKTTKVVFIVTESLSYDSALFQNEKLICFIGVHVQNYYYDQLSASSQDFILNKNVCFQGTTVAFRDICSQETRPKLDENCIIDLLETKFLCIGQPLPKIESCPPRKLQIETLDKKRIRGWNEIAMRFEKESKFIIMTENQDGFSVVHESFGDIEHAKEYFTKLTLFPENTYHLCYLHDTELQLLCSNGETSNSTKLEIVSEQDIFKIPYNIKVLHDVTNTRSRTLRSLAQIYKEKFSLHWVFYIELNSNLDTLMKSIDINESAIEKFVAKSFLNLEGIEYRLFIDSCKEKRNVALFFDAFDETLLESKLKFISVLLALLQKKISQIYISITPEYVEKFKILLSNESIMCKEVRVDRISQILIGGNQIDQHKLDNIIDDTECATLPLTESISSIQSHDNDDDDNDNDYTDTNTDTHTDCVDVSFGKKGKSTFLHEKQCPWPHSHGNFCTVSNAEELKVLEFQECEVDNVGNTSLHISAKNGNTTEIVSILVCDRNHYLLNKQNENEETPLYLACINNNNEAVRLLLTYFDCKLGICNKNGDSVLHALSINGNLEMMKLILERDPSLLNKQNKKGETPLHLASSENKIKTFVFLTSLADCSIIVRNNAGDTVLHNAAKNGSIKIMNSILERDWTLLNIKNKKNETPLLLTCRQGNVDAVKCLLCNRDCSVNIFDINGDTVLHHAARLGDVEIMQIILQRDRSILNMQNKEGVTPLNLAIYKSHVDAVKFLLSCYDCSVNLCDNIGDTVLHHAARGGVVEIMQLILQRDRSILNMQNTEGVMPLNLAIYKSHVDAVKFLLSCYDCSVNVLDNNGDTVLHHAAMSGDVEIMQLILQHDFTLVNVKNKHDETSLHYAIKENNFDAVKLLLSFPECLVTLKNNAGDTVLHYAIKIENVEQMDTDENEIISQLKSYESHLQPQIIEKKNTSLPGSSQFYDKTFECQDKYSRIKIIKLLLKLEPSLKDMRNNDGYTPLQLARIKNETDIVELLLSGQSLEQLVADSAAVHGTSSKMF